MFGLSARAMRVAALSVGGRGTRSPRVSGSHPVWHRAERSDAQGRSLVWREGRQKKAAFSHKSLEIQGK